MADFDIRDIAALKVKLQIIEKLVLADWILIILSMYYDWGGWIASLIGVQIILYIYKTKLRKQLKQKEYLAKVVEERTIELRIQRDQVLNESKNCPKPSMPWRKHRTNWSARKNWLLSDN